VLRWRQGLRSVPLEDKVLAALLNVLDGDAALDRARGIARHVGEARQAAELVLERRLVVLVLDRRLAQVVDDDAPRRGADHAQVAHHVHDEDLVTDGRAAGWRRRRRPNVPVPHRLVPAARDYHLHLHNRTNERMSERE